MNTAIICDWLIQRGGGERVLEALCEAYPSPLYTLFYQSSAFADSVFSQKKVHASWLNSLPWAHQKYRYYLPFFPMAIEQFDLEEYDLILSSSHCVAKGVLTRAHQLHLCYCHTPIRYAWDLTHHYLKSLSRPKKWAAQWVFHHLRKWDVASAPRVDHFATNSQGVAKRIQKIYGKPATVIYPPVDVEKIPFCADKEEYYITVSRLVPYKNIDLLVESFRHLPHKRLLIVGNGPEMGRLKAKASANIEFLGWQSDAVVHNLLKKAKGFLFAAEEDFGIAVVEAQAAGTPVLALGKGGCLETVVPDVTGLLFDAPTPQSLIAALERFDVHSFDPHQIRAHALPFSKERFLRELKQFVTTHYEAFHEVRHSCRR